MQKKAQSFLKTLLQPTSFGERDTDYLRNVIARYAIDLFVGIVRSGAVSPEDMSGILKALSHVRNIHPDILGMGPVNNDGLLIRVGVICARTNQPLHAEQVALATDIPGHSVEVMGLIGIALAAYGHPNAACTMDVLKTQLSRPLSGSSNNGEICSFISLIGQAFVGSYRLHQPASGSSSFHTTEKESHNRSPHPEHAVKAAEILVTFLDKYWDECDSFSLKRPLYQGLADLGVALAKVSHEVYKEVLETLFNFYKREKIFDSEIHIRTGIRSIACAQPDHALEIADRLHQAYREAINNKDQHMQIHVVSTLSDLAAKLIGLERHDLAAQVMGIEMGSPNAVQTRPAPPPPPTA